ncbi:MAG TPA: protein kinase [Pyrinomonadaceae bacterium]|nr:protein kinase [Pyrinomonadaceae bacterium]
MKYCPVCSTKYEDGVSFCAVDGEVLEDDPSTIVGTTLDGQYHVEAMLGKGGMGAVYSARHILLGDRVAIKVLPPQMRNNAEWLRRFRREGQAARRFRHPNAVTVYDLRTTSEGLIYMVMEFVEGHTLDAELKARGRFSAQDALQVLEPVMSVLNAAHAMGVVHRDLKPENIMIGKSGETGESVVKLLDLGIAKMREMAGSDSGEATKLTVAGQILGTPYYMSPEQWGEVPRDMNSEIDGRADIYSLGNVFYEIIAGSKPFNANSLAGLRKQHISQLPQPLHEVFPEIPAAFSRAIERAMSKDRSDRQTTAGELANELRIALGLPLLNASSPGIYASATGANLSEASVTHTGEIHEGRQTNADVTAGTVLTLDAMKQGSVAAAPPPTVQHTPFDQSASQNAQFASQAGAPSGTIASSPAVMNQSINPPAFSYAPSVAPAQPSRRSPVIPIVIALVLLLLIGGGAAAWFLMKGKGTDNGNGNAVATKGDDTNSTKGSDTGTTKTDVKSGGDPAATQEGLRYWLEVGAAQRGDSSTRVAGVIPLLSGQSFKFHFTPREDGYLYIVAPGAGNVPTTFLTAKPVPQSGVTSNQVRSGVDFAFPNGAGNWITLDQTPGSETYTIIFSPAPLAQPAFLTATAARALSGAEQNELDNFRNQYKANTAGTDVINGSGVDPFVSVKIPQSKVAGQPVIFDVRVEHK